MLTRNKASVTAHGIFVKQEEAIRNIAEDNWGNYDTGKYTQEVCSDRGGIIQIT